MNSTEIEVYIFSAGSGALSAGVLRVWVGSIKLEQKFPTPEVLKQLLYGSKSNSAADADVVALYLTDLVVTDDNEEALRNLLSKAMDDRANYVYNEEDNGLILRNIPAQLTHISEDHRRFVSLSVAVHRRNVQDYDGDGSLDYHDCFPLPVYLTCKSPRTNELTACGRAILAQDVVINRGGTVMDLVLLGANLDGDDAARAVQVSNAQRLLRARHGQRPFSAIIWGDLGNRLVATETLVPHVQNKDGKWELMESGVNKLVSMMSNQAGRHKLLDMDSLYYSGKDIMGQPFCIPPCNVKLRELFLLHVDAVKAQGLPVPLPSYKRSPLERTATELLGCEATCPDVVCLGPGAMLRGEEVKETFGLRAAYFGWKSKGKALQRAIKLEGNGPESGQNLYLQLGWLDGVGVYRDPEGTKMKATASVVRWETEERVQAYDHLPMRAVISVECEGGAPLRVWLCAVKLDYRQPTAAALEALLYGSVEASAEGADVIALSFTDLLVTEENVESLRRMLRKAMRGAEDYVFNEDDDGLVLRNIPAQLVRAAESGQRFVSLSVAVHRRNVQDYDGDGELDHHDCFPVPVYLTCKSPRKNEFTACGKAILAQDVVINRGGTVMDLVLLGANLDTDDEAKHGQLKELQASLKALGVCFRVWDQRLVLRARPCKWGAMLSLS